jgi:clan AA aspartic protease
MSTFTVRATLIHPEHRERSVEADLLVDTDATYTLLPPELVTQLGLSTPYQRRALLGSGERVVYPIGEVRVRLGDEERTTVFYAGSPGSRALLGAVTMEEVGLAADPVSGRLIPAPPALL